MVTSYPQKKPGFPFLRWLIIILIIVAVIHYGPRLWRHGDATPAGGPGAAGAGVPVSVSTVISKTITNWSEFSGILQAVHSAEIRPRVSGQITAVQFTDGSQVAKGQPLFIIDPRPYEAAVVSAKGTLTQEQSAFERAKKLIATKAISKAEFETAQSQYETALGNYNAAAVNLEYTHITAPISGKISRAELTEGNQVDAGSGAPLMASIVTLSPIYASFDVDEDTFIKSIQGVSAAKLKSVPVEVSMGNGRGDAMKGTIHSFDNQITPGSGTIRVRATLPNTNGLLIPGLYAKVRLGSADQVNAVLVNPTAVQTDQSKKFVMVVDADNKAQYREVTLGEMVDGLEVITSGLQPGEKIVVNGLQRVHPGVPVQGTDVDMLTLKDPNAPLADAPPASGTAAKADASPADKPADAPKEAPSPATDKKPDSPEAK
jgi:multidrug efflux system membrane fusion protein